MDGHILLVNFGGPRSLEEIEPFLIALLTDPDVIHPKVPFFLHKKFFTRVAKKRALKIQADYVKIGGKSPIFEDTEAVAKMLERRLGRPIHTFHRYLPALHAQFLNSAAELPSQRVAVFPMFPQFSYATTGSIARFFATHLDAQMLGRLRWIKSYAAHPAYIRAMQNCLRDFLAENSLAEGEVALLFSAHGLPQAFVDKGDPYVEECMRSLQAICKGFPRAVSRISFQSKFGRGVWLTPSTDEMCKNPLAWCEGRKQVVIVPLTFTSDHIETLFEIEEQYLPPLRAAGLKAYRCPALNRRRDWIEAMAEIVTDSFGCATRDLIRK